jgi:hypothetical protein
MSYGQWLKNWVNVYKKPYKNGLKLFLVLLVLWLNNGILIEKNKKRTL